MAQRQRRQPRVLPALAVAGLYHLSVLPLVALLVLLMSRVGGAWRALLLGSFLIVHALVLWGLLRRRDRLLASQRRTLEANEALVRALNEESADHTVLIGPDYTIRYASKSVRRAHPAPATKLTGAELRRYLHPDDRAIAAAALNSVLDGLARTVVTYRIQRPGGGWSWHETILTNHLDDPRVGGVVCNARDITESREHEIAALTLLRGATTMAQADSAACIAHQAVVAAIDATGAALARVHVGAPGGWRMLSEANGSHRETAWATGALVVAPGDPIELAAADRTVVVIDHPGQLGSAPAPAGPGGTAGAIHLPLLSGDVAIGVLSLWFERPRQFSAVLRNVLLTFGQQTALALERVELIGRLETALDDAGRATAATAALSDVTEAFSRSLTVDEVLNVAVGTLRDAVEPDRARAVLVEGPGSYSLLASYVAPGVPSDDAAPCDGAILLGLVAGGGSRWFHSATELLDELGPDAAAPVFEACAVLPLVIDGDVFGVLTVAFNGEHQWEAGEKALIESVSSLCTEAVRRARLYDQVHEALTRQTAAEAERRRLQDRMLELAEAGRRHMAEQLHDGPVQHLSIATMRLAGLRRQLEAPSPAVLRSLEQVETGVVSAIDELRTMMMRLYPPSFNDMSLSEAIAGAIAEPGFDFSVTFEDRGAPPMSVAVKAALYRVVVEALRNVQKHALATSATVILATEDGCIDLRIIDDGVGIDSALLSSPGHLGVTSLRDRIIMLGGTCVIERVGPEGGTVVHVRLPLPSEQDGTEPAVEVIELGDDADVVLLVDEQPTAAATEDRRGLLQALARARGAPGT